MRIAYVEIQNYRKLKSVHVDLTKTTTVFVGANNSGKTSAMLALKHFLSKTNKFSLNDFTLSSWMKIEQLGVSWLAAVESGDTIETVTEDWQDFLPRLDVWLEVAGTEVHLVKDLIPTLDWTGGLLGVRLQFEPKDCKMLCEEYLKAAKEAAAILKGAYDAEPVAVDSSELATAEPPKAKTAVALWPRSFCDFLEKRLPNHFVIKAYCLDPLKQTTPTNGIASLQTLPVGIEPIDGNPFADLIKIDTIDAHRGFMNSQDPNTSGDQPSPDRFSAANSKQLSVQLRTYYANHLDPSESPDASDLEALRAIQEAQEIFNQKLRSCFLPALSEVEGLGYPGFADPRLTISTKIKLTDGLNHSAAVQYELSSKTDIKTAAPMLLPEEYNGLGYQNLISMIFKLMSFRDGWMKVGKAGKRAGTKPSELPFHPPLHLVLIEEPEAHLHVQVQQVFIREAYKILRRHEDLGDKTEYSTQLVISTHSSHLAHECQFSTLRYFRRSPASKEGAVPTSTIVNLSHVFGKNDGTERFVTRYLKATHCDLFFADAAILVEGPAERILVPHFISSHFTELRQSYITLLEIGGSHAHRLRPLIDALGLVTLVITDLDASDGQKGKAVVPARNAGQLTRNATLKTWVPVNPSIDELLDLPSATKVLEGDLLYAVRVAYQHPLQVILDDKAGEVEVLANTFEDALLYQNIQLFRSMEGSGLVADFRNALNTHMSSSALAQELFDCLKTGDKAAFSLEVLLTQEPEDLTIPTYISDGLSWLQTQVKRRQEDILTPEVPSIA